MDVDRLLREEDTGWQGLHEAFARIPAERIEEGTVTPDGWSPKDVMFHVAAWLAECGEVLERMRAGTWDPATAPEETPAYVERANREWFEASRKMTAHDVRATFEAARQRAREGFGSLPAPSGEAWSWFEESGPLHYAKHLGDLEGWLGDAPAGA